MNKLLITALIIGLLFCFSCEKDTEPTNENNNSNTVVDNDTTTTDTTTKDTTVLIVKTYDVFGVVEKGPFINGSTVSLFELDENLSQSGKSFTAEVSNNKGSYAFNSLELDTNYIELQTQGFYFNEVSNATSSAQVSLKGLAQINDSTELNINILTHLISKRVKNLYAQGMAFAMAEEQAVGEILTVFNITDPINAVSSLQLTKDEILLAVSLIFQGKNEVSELSQLMADFSTDIEEDGTLDNETLFENLKANARNLNLPVIRQNIETKYAQLGAPITLGAFEKHIREFMGADTLIEPSGIEYPETGAFGENILREAKVEFYEGTYSMKAILPEGATLKIKIIGDGWGYPAFQEDTGWENVDYDMFEQSTTLVTTRTGEVELKVISIWNEDFPAITVEIYENGAETPIRTESLYYGNSDGFEVPEIGQYGQNLFAQPDSAYILMNETYSLAVDLPNDKEYELEINFYFDEENFYTIDTDKVLNWQVTQNPREVKLYLQGQNLSADLPIVINKPGVIGIQGDINLGLIVP